MQAAQDPHEPATACGEVGRKGHFNEFLLAVERFLEGMEPKEHHPHPSESLGRLPERSGRCIRDKIVDKACLSGKAA